MTDASSACGVRGPSSTIHVISSPPPWSFPLTSAAEDGGPAPQSTTLKSLNTTWLICVAMAPFMPFLYATRPSNTAGTG
eukprot:3625898-Pyramimonas_sp.AAC.2